MLLITNILSSVINFLGSRGCRSRIDIFATFRAIQTHVSNVTSCKFNVLRCFAINQDARTRISRVTRVTFGTRLTRTNRPISYPLARRFPCAKWKQRASGREGYYAPNSTLFYLKNSAIPST